MVPVIVEPGDVREAAARLAGVATRTPLLRSSTLDARVGATVFLKAEQFQRAGAFKFRGAYNRISRLTEDERRPGVAAFSSGNHAQAVALAARLVGTSAVIVMPADAPPEKIAATRGYGAQVVTYDRYTEDREEIGRRLAEERGATLVPPYDDPLIIAGQGTAALELLEEAGELDILLAPISGGGLIAGSAVAATDLSPEIRVIGVEPEAGDDTRRSLEAGRRVRTDVPRTIADGLQAHTPGALTFPINQKLLDGVVAVSDREIVEAMRFLFDRLKVVAEPSGATALAGLLAGAVPAPGRRIGVILSGGNIAAERFADLLGRRSVHLP
ncbi:MAG TPA: pyridoxal-phosphate dependent enzyme [Actinomycetota bacterium]|nr:pyridoxal-phosphate dependent enzyme [Actinomycetota bacterium]